MVIKTIDAAILQKCFIAGAKSIEAKKEYINELNVFPVPDGDTGTNMSMTIMAAASEVGGLVNPSMEELSKAISSGSLRGARGNSGVILSQLFRGFTREIKEHESIDVTILANAFSKAVETAYKAVMKPKEGTILTVARGGAEKALELVGETDNIVEFAEIVLQHMNNVLAMTPEMLPVLKSAGVVDSGGQGLIEVLTGAYKSLIGEEIDIEIPITTKKVTANTDNTSAADIKFGYCTEFIVVLEKNFGTSEELSFKAFLESIGDSIVVVADDEIVKVHVHTNDPGLAIQKGLSFGSLTKMKIDNMREEHNERLALQAEAKETASLEPRKTVGFISVSIGDGINEIFTGLGVDCIIEGGQTMNPSTEDMLNAIDKVNADNIFILPNNGNIILAAEQAKSITEDKNIIVVPTKNVPQGISALIGYMPEVSLEENYQNMINSVNNVKSGQVTYAVRDTNMDGKIIKQGDIMGIGDKTIMAVGLDVNVVTAELINTLLTPDSELISLYYGADIKEQDANNLSAALNAAYPNVEVELNYGGQPIYYYVVSVE